MSATDTKETPTPRVDAIVAEFTIPDDAMVSVEDACKIERDLTAVTAQRDRALGLLERFKDYLAMMVYDTDTENDHELHCFSCGACLHYEHSPDCSINGLLAEYEALRKGEM